jgi:predicted Rossmann fold nucleotide-binding protein DprA/Smf involved in DNA uptake
MNNFFTEDTKAIILLCGVFGKDRSEKPLSLAEYSSLVRWLIGVKMRPGDLLQKENVTEASMGSGIDRQRLELLLGRGVQLGFAVEEWQRNGIWIISRSDTDYPTRYKKHLQDKAPPLLFGVGDRSLLNGGGLGIVGSRHVDHEGEVFTRQVAELCAYNRMPIVSGGARGVDQIAMTAALEAGGVTIGILAENLLKKSVERSARHAITDKRLLLLSPYHPNARFTVGTAMGRNKLIYAMADYGLVVSAEYKKGGTWAGAIEELNRDNSRPVFVRTGNNAPLGNNKLLDCGAIAWPQNTEKERLQQHLEEISSNLHCQGQINQPSLFDTIENAEEPENQTKQGKISKSTENQNLFNKNSKPSTIYEAVIPVILENTKAPITSDELAKLLDVGKTQLNKWLQKAVEAGLIRKHSRPVRFESLIKNSTQQCAAPDRHSAL